MPHSFTHFFAPLYILKLETHNGSPLPFSPRRTLFILIIIPYTGIFRKYMIHDVYTSLDLGPRSLRLSSFLHATKLSRLSYYLCVSGREELFSFHFQEFSQVHHDDVCIYLLGLYAAKSHRLSRFLHPNKIVTVELLFFKCFSQKKPASAAHKFCYFTTIDPVNGQRVAPFSMTMMCDEWWLSVFWLND